MYSIYFLIIREKVETQIGSNEEKMKVEKLVELSLYTNKSAVTEELKIYWNRKETLERARAR